MPKIQILPFAVSNRTECPSVSTPHTQPPFFKYNPSPTNFCTPVLARLLKEPTPKASESVHCVGFRWPKTTILGKFWQFWALLYRPLIPMRVKFGMLEQTQGLHLPAKFHLNVFIVSASNGQKPQFWTNFDIFGGSSIDDLLPMWAKFGVL